MVASRFVLASRPATASVPACWARIAGAVIVAQPTSVPREEDCAEVEAANAHSTEEFAVVALVHSGEALADCSAVLPAHDSARAVDPAELWAVGWTPVDYSAALPAHDSAPAVDPAEPWAVGWAPADYSAALPAHDSTPAVDLAGPWAVDSVPACLVLACLVPAGSVVLTAQRSTPADSSAQGDRCGQRYSLDARPAHSPVAELPHDSPERYKASPLVSREQPPGLGMRQAWE